MRIKITSNFLLTVITGVLVIVTGIYASFTWSMAKTMEKQFDLSFRQFQQSDRPYLFTDNFEWELDERENVLFSMYVKNSGGIPAKFEIEKALYIIDGNEYNWSTSCEGDIFVFPNSKGRGFKLMEPSKEAIDLIISKGNFKIIFKINYWGIGDENKKNTFTFEEHREFFRNPDSPSGFEAGIIFIDAN